MLIIAYLCGSINSAIITCFFLGLPSPRSVGSGNPGATNVLRVGGKLAALITLTGDALKGFIPVIIAHFIGLNHTEVAYIALAGVLGHIFPLFFAFKGGKGVATLIGVMFGFDWPIGLIFIGLWLIFALVTGYSSLSALIASVIAAVSVIFMVSFASAMPFLIIAAFVILRHRQNIVKLLNGTESKIGQKSQNHGKST